MRSSARATGAAELHDVESPTRPAARGSSRISREGQAGTSPADLARRRSAGRAAPPSRRATHSSLARRDRRRRVGHDERRARVERDHRARRVRRRVAEGAARVGRAPAARRRSPPPCGCPRRFRPRRHGAARPAAPRGRGRRGRTASARAATHRLSASTSVLTRYSASPFRTRRSSASFEGRVLVGSRPSALYSVARVLDPGDLGARHAGTARRRSSRVRLDLRGEVGSRARTVTPVDDDDAQAHAPRELGGHRDRRARAHDAPPAARPSASSAAAASEPSAPCDG